MNLCKHTVKGKLQRMGIISPIILFILLISSLAFNIPKSHAQERSKNEHDYWFFYYDEIVDIRDFSPILKVNSNSHGIPKVLDNGDFLICEEYAGSIQLTKYDKNKKKLWSVGNIQYISPNWKYQLYLSGSDIWISYIDWKSGKQYGKKQLTQLGVLGHEIVIVGWYKNKIIFAQGNQTYLLDVKTSEIEKSIVRKSYQYPHTTSPDGRYLSEDTNAFFTNKTEPDPNDNLGTRIYDFETNQFLKPKDRANPTYWINDTTYIVAFSKIEEVSRKYVSQKGNVRYNDEEVKNLVIRRININDLSNYKESMLFNKGKHYEGYGNVDMYRNDLGRYYKILGTTYNGDYHGHFLYVQNTPDSKAAGSSKSTYLFDENTGKTHLITENSRNSSVPYFYKARYASIDKENIVYSLKGDLLVQGTFSLNLTTGEKKKITPYIADRFWHFKKAGYLLFIVNNYLYRCDSNGDNLKILKKGVSKKAKISLFNGRSKEDNRGKQKR